jgi:hypothetical protein
MPDELRQVDVFGDRLTPRRVARLVDRPDQPLDVLRLRVGFFRLRFERNRHVQIGVAAEILEEERHVSDAVVEGEFVEVAGVLAEILLEKHLVD